MLRAGSKERAARANLLAKPPGFDNLEEEAANEQVGEQAPLALQQQLGLQASVVSTPAPASPDVMTIGLVKEEKSFPVHVDVTMNGVRQSTAVFASLPAPVTLSGSQFVVGANYKTALVFLHGGGTPSATGKNGMTLGEKMAAMGIPVIAPDMPGHGRATRNPKGLLTFQQQVDFLMQVIDQMIHPGVKIVLAGHSWGGEFVAFMHRLSADPKYARIVQYISLSPPVDTSAGEGPLKRIEHEEKIEREFDTLRKRIAPKDFDFVTNILKNGKDSDNGGLFCDLTSFDYNLPPLTKEQQRLLKPLTVIVGENDGLVYVGREEHFKRVWGGLEAPSRLIVLGPGRTYESKKPEDVFPTGHNIFDVYIEGTTTPFVYNFIGETLKAEGVNPLPVADKNILIADLFLRHYLSFPGFREMVSQHAEFVDTGTPYLHEISARKTAVDGFLSAVEARREKHRKEIDEKVQAALQAMRLKLGITEAMTPERAREELSVAAEPLAEERRAELEAYRQRIDAIDDILRTDFSDPQSEAEFAALSKEYEKVLSELGITELGQHEAKLKELSRIKRPDAEQARQRGELGRMNQRYLEILKGKKGRYSVERDRRTNDVPTPDGIPDLRTALRELRADRSPERRAKLEAFLAEYPVVESAARLEALKEAEAAIDKMKRPDGVASLEQAEAIKRETDARLSYTFVPPGAPDLKVLAARIQQLAEEARAASGGVDSDLSIAKLDAAVRAMKAKRDSLLNKWNGLWAKNILSSPAYSQASETAEHSHQSWKDINTAYRSKRQRWMLDLKLQGRLTDAALLASTPELLRLRRQAQHARRVYLRDAEAAEKAKWSEAEAGRLTGPEGAVREAQKAALEIRELETLLKADEDLLEQRRQRYSVAMREYNELRVDYTRRMTELGLPVPYTVEEFRIYQYLNLPLAELLKEMNARPQLVTALQNTLSKWDDILRELKREHP